MENMMSKVNIRNKRNQFSIIKNNSKLIDSLSDKDNYDILKIMGKSVIKVGDVELVFYDVDNVDLINAKYASKRMETNKNRVVNENYRSLEPIEEDKKLYDNKKDFTKEIDNVKIIKHIHDIDERAGEDVFIVDKEKEYSI